MNTKQVKNSKSLSLSLLILSLGISIFLCIVLWNINRESFWGDEAFSVYSIGGGGEDNSSTKNAWDFSRFWRIILDDNHPFLYNLCLKIYAHYLGYSDFTLRFFSTLWILFGALISYLLLYKHHYKILALVYTLLFLLAPNTIYYAQECRNYAMLLSLASIYCILLYLVFESMRGALELKHKMWYFVGIFICAVGMVLTHYYAYVFVFCTGILALIHSYHLKSNFYAFFICFGLSALVGILWVSIHHIYGGFLYRIDSEWTYKGSIYFLLFSTLLSALGKFGWAFVIILGIICLKQKGLAPYKKLFVFAYMIILELLCVTLIFTCISQTMTQRYFMEIYPLIYLLIASMLLSFKRYLAYIVSGLIIILALHGAYISTKYHKEDLAQASAYIATHFDPKVCKLPVGWIAYTRYLPQFEAIEMPLMQEHCDLILLSTAAENDVNFSRIKAFLHKYGISDGYEILFFNGAIVVQKSLPTKLKEKKL